MQTLSANFGLDAENPVLSNRNLNPLFVAYRTIKRNNSINTPIQNLKYGFNYSYNNFNKAAAFLLSYYHVAYKQSEIRNYVFTKDFDYYNLRYEQVQQKIDNIYLKFDKYFYSLKTAFSIKHSLVWFNNPAEVNSIVTSNKFFNYNANFSIRPSLGNNVNLNLGIDYKYNKDIISGNNTFQLNPFADLLLTAGKKLSFGGRLNYFYSNFDIKNRNYFFGNFYAWYTIKPKKVDLKFSIFNFLNTDISLSGTATSAVTKSVNNRLLSRYALVELIYKF